ncbi:serpin B13-like [Haemaphysalis longicornis]
MHAFDMAYDNMVHYDHHRVCPAAQRPAPSGSSQRLFCSLHESRMPWDFDREPEPSRAEVDRHARCYAPSFEADEILPRGTVSPSTLVLLLSVVDFEGSWKYPFDTKGVSQDAFYVNPKSPISVDVIKLRTHGRFFDSSARLGATVLEVPYQEPTGLFRHHTKARRHIIGVVIA